MIGLFENILFLNPWILAGLAALPALWYLLRITPPPPKLIKLPTAGFLKDLQSDTQTPSQTPWWILLLRLIIAALVIFALAHPVFNPAGKLAAFDGPARLIIDNGWASAQTWEQQMQAAQQAVAQAGRDKREIYIQTTANAAGEEKPASFGPLSAGQAESVLKGLIPVPWAADYRALAKHLRDRPLLREAHNFWFAHGLDQGHGFEMLARALQQQGGLTYYKPTPEKLPVALSAPKTGSYELEINIIAPENIPEGRPVTVEAQNDQGGVLDQQSVALNPADIPQNITFDLPAALQNEVSQIRIAGPSGAGGLYILGDRLQKHSVGLAGPDSKETPKPFIEARYYLSRALEPFATLHQGNLAGLIEQNPSVIILPDVGGISTQTLNALETWVREGGLLLRFAGPNMTQNPDINFLVPVPLRSSGRSLEGSLTWENPLKLDEFPPTSPLYGITLHDDITVRRQILAEPSEDLEEKTWARLEDGTPLITASPLDDGLLIMVHTTASPDWSDLALSGAYVDILQRIVNLSGSKTTINTFAENGVLQPSWVLDGLGVRKKPDSSVRSILASELENTQPGSVHPPGLYERGGMKHILNIGDHLKSLQPVDTAPSGVQMMTYGQSYEQDLLPYLLFAALTLLLLDWLIMLLLASGMAYMLRTASIAALFFLPAAQAHAGDQSDMAFANTFHLAYVRTGNAVLDSTSKKGLENLATILVRRTSVDPIGVTGVNPETDTLAFFPLLYWPVSEQQTSLTVRAIENIQHYLDHGGTILFDTRDQAYRSATSANTRNSGILQNLTQNLNIPPLIPAPDNHVLTRSFYLIDRFPGQYDGGTLWVENLSDNERDGVSSVIIGSNDWASAWATGLSNRSLTGNSRQKELAYRFGVNLVLYTLTGNYKADQVHVPHILERLGQ